MNNVIKGIEFIILSFLFIFKISVVNYRIWLFFVWIIIDISEVNVSFVIYKFFS